jgi:hypothetical protein
MVRVRPWWLWFGVFGIIAALAVPITISFDGLLYVQGSQAIFTDEAFDGFQWTRGPLYPLIIRAVRFAGGTGSIWIVAAQATAAAIAAWVVARAVIGRGWALWFGMGLILLNPLTLGYAGSVLQQTWVTVVLALNAGLIWVAIDGRASSRQLTAGVVGVTVGSTFLISQLAYVCAFTGAFVAWAHVRRSGRVVADDGPLSPRERAVGLVRPLAISVLVLASVLGLSRAVLVPWHSYERSVLQGAESNSIGIPTHIPEPSPIEMVRSIPERLPVIVETASIILDIPLPGASSTWGGDENEFFGFQPFFPPRRCGVVQYNDMVEAASNATEALVTATCVSKGFQMAINEVVPVGRVLHRLASFVFVASLLVLPWSRRGREVLIIVSPFYAYWMMYSIYGASLDRYGFPLYAGSAALLAFLILTLVESLRRRGGRARARQAAAGTSESTTPEEKQREPLT